MRRRRVRRRPPGARRALGTVATAVLLAAACPAEVEDRFEAEAIEGTRWQPIGLPDRDRIVGPFADHRSRAAEVRIEPADVERRALTILAEQPRADCPPEPPEVVQRSERRLRDEPAFGEGRWYGFAFRMAGAYAPTGSARWVIGQWKQTESCWSPFLAQRYDNGVFHVTVEDEDCRAIIAKAPGDPHAGRPPRLVAADDAVFALDGGDGLRGEAVEWSPRAGQPCRARIRLDPHPPPDLPSPRDGWVRMTYFVKGGTRGDARIEVWADGRRHVVATGWIGEPRAGTREQFKFGLYRQQLALHSSMLFDGFRRGATREAVDPALCGE